MNRRETETAVSTPVPDTGSWDSNDLHLAAGNLVWTPMFDDAHVRITHCRADGIWKLTDTYRGDDLVFSFPLPIGDRSAFRYHGRSLDCRHGVVWGKGERHEYVLFPGFSSLMISIRRELVDSLDWKPVRSGMRAFSREQLARLAQSCRDATIASRTRNAANGRSLGEQRERILRNLKTTLATELSSSQNGQGNVTATRGFLLVKQYERLLEDGASTDRFVSANAAAQALGVSRRTLFRAFHNWIGMGPNKYAQLLRLYRVRANLLSQAREGASVTRCAGEAGFHHVGRMATAYRAQFGEYPSDTLRRVV